MVRFYLQICAIISSALAVVAFDDRKISFKLPLVSRHSCNFMSF